MRCFTLVRSLSIALAVGLAAAGLVLAGGAGASATAWRVQPSPNPSDVSDALSGVAVSSSTSAWAVGVYDKPIRSPGSVTFKDRTLIERWNGRAWKVQSSPNPTSRADGLNAVAATSSTNAWAVGDYGNDTRTLIEHWNGKGWTVQPSPSPGPTGNVISGVAATSSTNAWAVGFEAKKMGNQQGLVEHWDGKAWKVQPSPNPSGSSETFLNAVAATSSTNAWAVGGYGNAGMSQSLIVRWNGKAWSVEPSPNPSCSSGAVLDGVAAISSTSAWAVGYCGNGHSAGTVVEHWNGSTWTVEPSPSPGLVGSGLNAVAAISSTSVWAVGSYSNAPLGSSDLVEHWNGKAWKVQPSATVRGFTNFSAVTASSSTGVWAVGDNQIGLDDQSLIEHRNG